MDQLGAVLEIQRMSTEDGPGLRTTVFFRGCSLACRWCHNPESLTRRRRVLWHSEHCIGCDSCGRVCEHGALRQTADGIAVDPTLCARCGACVDECPAGALRLAGEDWTLPELIDEVCRDRAYLVGSDRGGVTASGGEPTLQAAFVRRFLEACRERGLHTALDTCGECRREQLEEALLGADLVLYDLKGIDATLHSHHTGRDNARILEHARLVASVVGRDGGPDELWIRTPLIPGMTAEAAVIEGVGQFVAEQLGDVVSRWELCAFNNLCRQQYVRLGQAWELANAPLLTPSELDALGEIAKATVPFPERVHVSGPTARETGEDRHD